MNGPLDPDDPAGPDPEHDAGEPFPWQVGSFDAAAGETPAAPPDEGPATVVEMLETLGQRIIEHTDAMTELYTIGAGHAGQIATLTARVGDLGKDDHPPGPSHLERFRFERVPEDQAQRAQAELSVWVPWLVGTYRLNDLVTPCWPRHDGLAEELAALYLAWVGAWSTDSDPAGPLVWHERLERFCGRPPIWGRGATCDENQCALSPAAVENLDKKLDRWLAANERVLDNLTVDAYRLSRARVVLPAPRPARPDKPASTSTSAAAHGGGSRQSTTPNG